MSNWPKLLEAQLQNKAFGVSNVIQNTGLNDILIIKAKSDKQLKELVENYIPEGFEGFILSNHKLINSKLTNINYTLQQLNQIESELIEFYYPSPEKKINFIGITGTNGKTSTAWFCMEVGAYIEKNILYMGTMGCFLAGKKVEFECLTTTPSFLDLRKLINQCSERIDAVVLELSSHALSQGRLNKLHFDVGAWTNFTQDHLDYHKTMDEYFEAKSKIFLVTKENSVYVPISSTKLVSKINSIGNEVLECQKLEQWSLTTLPGQFQKGFTRENLELAVNLIDHLYHEDLQKIDFNSINQPKGRFEVIEKNNRVFIIDYAHTPDALTKLLEQVQVSFPKQRVWTLIGCGGNRDKTKRALMAKCAEALSDVVILTSDNPRDEDPLEIIEDMKKGFSNDAYMVEAIREEAIEKSYKQSNDGDVIVIAGKGHEEYQEIKGKRYSYSDFEVIGRLDG